MTKRCCSCGLEKSLDDFSKRARNKTDGRQSYCKSCHAGVCAARYVEKKDSYKESQRKYRRSIRRRIWHYLESRPCIDCGEADPRVLEFDHVRGAKKFAISQGANEGRG